MIAIKGIFGKGMVMVTVNKDYKLMFPQISGLNFIRYWRMVSVM